MSPSAWRRSCAVSYTHLDVYKRQLLGPSGCGKTTLLKSIAGFLQPESGRILIDGQDVSRLPAHRRPLNTVFQNLSLIHI